MSVLRVSDQERFNLRIVEESRITMVHKSSENKKSPLRTLIHRIDNGLAFLGTVVVIGAIVLVHDFSQQIIVAGGGILMIGFGIGRYTSKYSARQRKYNALRSELLWFHSLAQKLNDAALGMRKHDAPEARRSFADTHEAMRESVERMADVAGRTDVELAARDRGHQKEQTYSTNQTSPSRHVGV